MTGFVVPRSIYMQKIQKTRPNEPGPSDEGGWTAEIGARTSPFGLAV